MKTFSELIISIKKEINEISTIQVQKELKDNTNVVLIDVREKDEILQGYIANSINIPRGFLEIKIENSIPSKEQKIIVYCAAGTRSAMATKTLIDMGYANVYSMTGGFNLWKEEGYKFIKDEISKFTQDQLIRYSRQILLDEVGEKGQIKLLKAKVLLVGAGGLGSPAAYYLTASGVGTIGIIDNDLVDLSNLHRQILHNTSSIGDPKVDSAKQTLKNINPDVKFITYQERLNKENSIQIIKEYDLVLDCTDNFDTKYIINDSCYLLKKPNIYGSIFKFEGQLTVFHPDVASPCYRCLFSSPPPPNLAPNCAEIGVLGILPGVIGTLQAVEAIKILLGIGENMSGKLLIYDSLNTTFKILKFKKDPQCSLCGS